MIPGKVIPLRAPRRHRPRAKKTVARVVVHQQALDWLAGNTTRGTVLLAGVVAGLIIGTMVATAILATGQPEVEAFTVESLG